MERNHRMELQYDGTGLHGWAKQDGLQTVEGCLEEAFQTVLGKTPVLRVAGRTDAAVHARQQVVSLLLPDELDLAKLRCSLNALTPPGIAIMGLRTAPGRFDARKDATSRSYRYFLCADQVVSPFWTRYCWQVCGGRLDVNALVEGAALVVGRHHFRAFTPRETEHVFLDRTVLRCRWTRMGGAVLSGGELGAAARPGRGSGGMLCLQIEADAFLRHMVRTLVGTMIEVGQGGRSLKDFKGLLAGAPREAAGPTAPAHGLFLWDIRYARKPRDGAGSAREAAIPVGESQGERSEDAVDSEA